MLTRRDVLAAAAALAGSVPLKVYASISHPDIAGDPPTTIREAAALGGYIYGIAVQADDRLALPGPNGVGTLAEFIEKQAALYAPGIAFLPEHVQPEMDHYTLDKATRFIERARADGKDFRVHCMLYPGHEPPWVETVVTADNWRDRIDSHFEAIASVGNVHFAKSIDVTNELISAKFSTANGYRPNIWYRVAGDSYVVYAFQKARSLFPTTSLYWCHDQTEQLTDSFHIKQANFVLRAIERAMNAGAPIDGYNMQGHLELRLGLDQRRLRTFLSDLHLNLGLKIIIGELDCRTGYSQENQAGSRPPNMYYRRQYDEACANLVEGFLDIALPFVKESGGKEVITWGISDVDNSWQQNDKKGTPPGERPLPFDSSYRPKLMNAAMISALTRNQ